MGVGGGEDATLMSVHWATIQMVLGLIPTAGLDTLGLMDGGRDETF